jgi:hypothetical protein
MRQLDGDRYVGPAPNALQGPGYCGFGRVVPEPDIAVGDPSLGQNGACLDGQQRRARERKMPEVDDEWRKLAMEDLRHLRVLALNDSTVRQMPALLTQRSRTG